MTPYCSPPNLGVAIAIYFPGDGILGECEGRAGDVQNFKMWDFAGCFWRLLLGDFSGGYVLGGVFFFFSPLLLGESLGKIPIFDYFFSNCF